MSRGGLTCKANAMSLSDQVVQDNLKTPRRWLGLRLAQSAGLVQDALAQTAQGRQRTKDIWEHQKKILGMAPTTAPIEDEDVGNIVVGDQQTTVYNMAQEQKSGTLGKFAKAAMLGAALLGSGGVGAAAMAWMCGVFDKPTPHATEAPKVELPTFDPDGYGLKIVPDSEIHE